MLGKGRDGKSCSSQMAGRLFHSKLFSLRLGAVLLDYRMLEECRGRAKINIVIIQFVS